MQELPPFIGKRLKNILIVVRSKNGLTDWILLREKIAMIINANSHLPAVTAQDVGRELYHKRHDEVKILGTEDSLKRIAWILGRVDDMFKVQARPASLVVRRVSV